MKKPYIAKDRKDPGRMVVGDPPDFIHPKPTSNRELLIRICEKLGVPTQ